MADGSLEHDTTDLEASLEAGRSFEGIIFSYGLNQRICFDFINAYLESHSITVVWFSLADNANLNALNDQRNGITQTFISNGTTNPNSESQNVLTSSITSIDSNLFNTLESVTTENGRASLANNIQIVTPNDLHGTYRQGREYYLIDICFRTLI